MIWEEFQFNAHHTSFLSTTPLALITLITSPASTIKQSLFLYFVFYFTAVMGLSLKYRPVIKANLITAVLQFSN